MLIGLIFQYLVSVYHIPIFVCLIKKGHHIKRNTLAYLSEKGIATRPGTHAVHNLAYYKDLGSKPWTFHFQIIVKNSFALLFTIN